VEANCTLGKNNNMKEKIKEKIVNYTNEKYEGSLKRLRDSNLHKFLSPEDLHYIRDTVDMELQSPASIMIWCFLNDVHEQPTCPCGNDTKFDQVRKRFRPFCSEKCQRTLFKQTVDKRSATCLERYGNRSYIGSVEGIRKTKEACVEKYGIDNYSKTDQFKEKRKTWKRLI
jgi:hypothetical protein